MIQRCTALFCMCLCLAAGLAWAASVATSYANSPAAAVIQEPPVPPGLSSPGAVLVALLGPGIDYRLPDLRDRLARDGEGELIAWDFSDGDNRPFTPAETTDGTPVHDGSGIAREIGLLAPRSQLIVVKELPGDHHSFGHMMTFVAKTPAQIVTWLGAAPSRPDWPILAEAVKRFQDRLFIVPIDRSADDIEVQPHFAGIRGAPNALIVAHALSLKEVTGGPKSVDLWIQISPDNNVVSMRHHLASMAAGLAARALAGAGSLSAQNLKRYVMDAHAPSGLGNGPSPRAFIAAEAIRQLLRPPQ